MARESFTSEEVAHILNTHFVCIKMDKEQYPHIDGYFQKTFQLLNKRSGGWPLSIFMTPAQGVFFAGTYLPKNTSHNSMGFVELCERVVSYPKTELEQIASEVASAMKQNETTSYAVRAIDAQIETKIISGFEASFDKTYKGFYSAPKFPHATSLSLLLQLHLLTKNDKALQMATESLSAMSEGGIYDQIEGGFYRYSVDEKWQIPHFEKMLYTNAELVGALSLAQHICPSELFEQRIEQTLQEMDRRFLQNQVYQSASNADSQTPSGESMEGYYFVYDYDKAMQYLLSKGVSEQASEDALEYLSITQRGNFEDDLSNPYVSGSSVPQEMPIILAHLAKMREKKQYPFIDYKINTAWNALYLVGKLQASALYPKYLNEATQSLDALLELMYVHGVLYHQSIKGVEPTQEGLLEDYAFLARACFVCYEQTRDEKYFEYFQALTMQTNEKFYKKTKWLESCDGFDTFADTQDNAYASALATHAMNLLALSLYVGDSEMHALATIIIQNNHNQINKYSFYYATITMAYLMGQYGVIVKTNAVNIDKFKTEKLDNPFVCFADNGSDKYEICNFNSCFAQMDNLEEVQSVLEGLLPRL